MTHDLAVQKLRVVEEEIADLTLMREALQKMVRQCERKHKQGTCPIIQSLIQDQVGISHDAVGETKSLNRKINTELSGRRKLICRMRFEKAVSGAPMLGAFYRARQKV